MNVNRFNERKLFFHKKKKSRWYSAEIIANGDHTNDLALLANTPARAHSMLHSLEHVARGIGLYMISDKAKIMCFNQNSDIFSLNGKLLNLINQLIYLSSSISFTEKNVNIGIDKAYTPMDMFTFLWKSDRW